MEFAPITYQLWEAFVEERKQWEIIQVTPETFIATDRKRFVHGEAFTNPIEVTMEYTAEYCRDRQAAAFYIGLRSMQVALTTVGIIHADT